MTKTAATAGTRALKALKAAAVRTLLSARPLRHRIAFEIRSRYFAELDVIVPLSPHVACPIPHNEAWSSFHEIFVQQEYAPVYARIPLPRRWIDLGCHAGFFTADILMRRDRAGAGHDWSALLVDADSRSASAVARFAAFNRVAPQIHFRHGAIAAGTEARAFVERPFMSSTLADLSSEPGRPQRVPVFSAADILREFAPPYDLVKVDIEGAEREFLDAYGALLAATRFLLVEWHHWPDGGLSEAQTRELAASRGFRLLAQIVPARPCGGGDDPAATTCGVLLFENSSPVVPA